MNLNKLKKNIILLGVVIALGTLYCSETEYQPDYEILEEDDDAYAKYEDGKIYIGSEDYIDSLKPNNGDILVIDQRSTSDPNMKVRSSFEIHDKNKRNTIIEVLQEYEKEHPSNWNRTTETMRLEWFIHNLCYENNYETERAQDVDLNNQDEEVYKSKILRKIFRI